MKRSYKSKSKSKGKDRIKIKAYQNTDKKEPKAQIPQIKPVSINQLQNLDKKLKEPENPPIEKKDEKAEKIEQIFKGAENPPKYEFNLHKHLKENLKFKDKLCNDGLTKNSLYCLDCKKSTCPKCPEFSTHNGHNLIHKFPYYICNENLINDNFTDLNNIFALNPDFLDVHKIKEEMKKLVIDYCKILFDKLEELKKDKLKEIDEMFAETDNCYETLKQNVQKMKEDIKKFLEKQKKFLCLDVNENTPDSQINDIIKNLQELSKPNDGLITSNKDNTNAVFLITYDLLKNTENINDQIKYFINDIRLNRIKYFEDFTNKKNIIYDDMQKLQNAFDGALNYQYLTNDFYKLIYDKIASYNDRIENMKKKIMDKVNKKGNFEDVEKDNKVSGTHFNLKFEHILNNQVVDQEEAKSILKTKKSFKRTLTSGSKGPLLTSPRSTAIKHVETGIYGDRKNVVREKVYNNSEEVKLDKVALQDYFAYEALNLIDKKFRIKKSKKQQEQEQIDYAFDEEIDFAKPIPCKAEIQIYDRKTTNLIRKTVKFDKNKHKYLNFLTGCRCVLIKDKLYILGGVDKENNITKVAWIYYIKENELKPMPDMLHPHAYHAVEFLEFYKSIVVIGAQNCPYCELFDTKTGQWRDLPQMKIPRAHCILYLDKITHILYAFFGILGKIAEKNNNFSDALECLEFKKLALGWQRVDYNNRADISFRTGINQLLPLNPEMILVYGGSSMREFVKKSAVYVLPRQEMVRIDNRMFNEIREASKKSKKLSKILSSTE
jgi:hypothetical protein